MQVNYAVDRIPFRTEEADLEEALGSKDETV